ncbi:DUF3727 domain-containing protein [Synechocystis sp. LKSZ1]|uniref:DUF3727 domain-containing protein n=1 Tax=Synechocystis sp. LKSZ1 TaxID=3144951 RepID=UPI00336C0CAB
MSSYLFSQENEPDEADSVTLRDEAGRTLDCYIENSLDFDDATYLLLMPVDIPIVIIAWEDEADSEEEDDAEAVLLEDNEEIELIFADAKAVLEELNLSLKYTAYTLTVSGELPPIEDEDILTLELDEAEEGLEPEELQFLASFYHQEQRYSIYTPLAPLLFLAKSNVRGDIELVTPEEERMQYILEELLFEEGD